MKKLKINIANEGEKSLISESNIQESEMDILRKKLVRLEKKYKRLKTQNESYLSAANRDYDRKVILEKENKNLHNAVSEQRLTITMLTHCLYLFSDKEADQNNNSYDTKSRDIELKEAMKILIPLAHSAKNDLLKKHNLKEFSESQN